MFALVRTDQSHWFSCTSPHAESVVKPIARCTCNYKRLHVHTQTIKSVSFCVYVCVRVYVFTFHKPTNVQCYEKGIPEISPRTLFLRGPISQLFATFVIRALQARCTEAFHMGT